MSTSHAVAAERGTEVESAAIHIVMRFSNRLFDVGDVALRHKNVIDTNGCVWIGKFGARPGSRTVSRLRDQIARGTPTWLFLVSSGERAREIYRAEIEELAFSLSADELRSVPDYYADKGLHANVGAWFRTTALKSISKKSFETLMVDSSHREILWSLAYSMSGFFVVRETTDV